MRTLPNASGQVRRWRWRWRWRWRRRRREDGQRRRRRGAADEFDMAVANTSSSSISSTKAAAADRAPSFASSTSVCSPPTSLGCPSAVNASGRPWPRRARPLERSRGSRHLIVPRRWRVACGQKSAVAGGRCRGASQREHGSKALRRIRGCFYFSCGGAVSLHINFTFLLFEQFVQLTLEASEDAPPDGNGTWNTVAWHASKTLTPH